MVTDVVFPRLNSYEIITIIGGIATIIGVIVGVISLDYSRRQTSFTEKKMSITQENQITERFTRAIDQLGNPNLEIRLSGVYALERISDESEKNYWPIIEILTAYIRTNSTVDKFGNKMSRTAEYISEDVRTDQHIEYTKCEEDDPIVESISMDIQTILTILGKRRRVYNSEESKHLDLSYKYLGKAKLEGAHLEGVNLEGANLVKANLEGANLEGTNLRQANLCNTVLDRANLEKANLKSAKIRGNLIEANLEMANLERAYLMVDLKGANLKGANLKQTHFKHSFFDGGANLEGANLEGAQLEWSFFEGANLEKTNLKGARIIEPEDLSFDQLSKVKTLYNTKLDEYYTPLKENYPALFEKPDQDET